MDVLPPEIPRVDERALRKPGWRAGRWFVLGDLQPWCLPPVDFRLVPNIRGDGGLELAPDRWPEAQVLPSLCGYGCPDNEPIDSLSYLQWIGVGLVLQNYALDGYNEFLDRLIPIGFRIKYPSDSQPTLDLVRDLSAYVVGPALRLQRIGNQWPSIPTGTRGVLSFN